MATRLQIARARARVALAFHSKTVLPESVVETAKLEFSEASDASKMVGIPTRLQIAQSRARVALAARTGTILPPEVIAAAKMEFSEASDRK